MATNWKDSSNYVARFRALEQNNIAGALGPGIPPPEEVINRLKTYSLQWEDLSNFTKQALVWDTGYVIANVSGVDKWLRVNVAKSDLTMASIALTNYEFTSSGQTQRLDICTYPNGSYTRQKMADFDETNPRTFCTIEDTKDKIEYSHSSIFAQDALGPNNIPEPRVYMHKDHKGIGPSIHGKPRGWTELTWNTCQKPTEYSGLIIPCTTESSERPSYRPKPSSDMNEWLTSLSKSNSSSSTGLIVGVCVGAAFVLGLIAFFVIRRKRQQDAKGQANMTHQGTDYIATPDVQVPTNELSAGYVALGELDSCRLNEKDLVLKSKLGAGAFADVWLGTFRESKVAIKKLHNSRVSSSQVVSFVEEIKLMSSFDSPFIVQLIGAAWTRATDICCVMELMDGGDLKSHLDKTTRETFPWHEKYVHMYSIASGLVYLHSLNVLHRDIKSRNILLDSTKGTKLTDFGISKEDLAATMTLGVGTFRWMAPEVVQDQAYTVAADIYSFGCVLSEFDTHHIPYEDLKNQTTGQMLSDSAIMVRVTSGSIKPTFSAECPVWIHDLATQCLQLNPDDRPTAAQVAFIIRSKLKELSIDMFSL